jgi:site-specific DNA recombinase
MKLQSRTKGPENASGAEAKKMVRCAIYTRKSTEEGLDLEFNSLDAQREAAEAFVHSQRHEGWLVVSEKYDDGGFSGGNMERPSLKRLLSDVEAKKVDAIVVYKVDRLSRSLLDFSRIMETLDRHGCSFVSVTQQFNTTHSMGRLTLNILLSFAQFEREIISERTRDKMSAARRKGKWTGGSVILGYNLDSDARKLVINEEEARVVQQIFALHQERRSILATVEELNSQGVPRKTWVAKSGKTAGGGPWTTSNLTLLLTNLAYLGKVDYQGKIYDAEHEPIISMEMWGKTQALLERKPPRWAGSKRTKFSGLLKGLLKCGSCGCSMIHTYTSKGTTRYRYYVCIKATKQGAKVCSTRSIPAKEIEDFVVGQIAAIGRSPDLIEKVEEKARSQREIRLTALEAERAEIEKSLRHNARLVAGIFQLPNASSRLAALEEQLRAGETRLGLVVKEIAAIQSTLVSVAEIAKALGAIRQLFDSMPQVHQARCLSLLLDQVLYDREKGTVAISFRPSGIKVLAAEKP